MLKIALIVASVGGPAKMPALFENGFSEDAAWLILQRHADGVAIDGMAAALAEMTGRKVGVARKPQVLHGGDILVLSPDLDYTFSGQRLQPQTSKVTLHLDRFLLALSDAKAAVACLMLTGPELEGQGAAGLKALAGSGARLYAIDGLPLPAQTAIDHAVMTGLLAERLPLVGALAKVSFGRAVAESHRS
jgi:chemotaxis response regulator CheB